MRFIVIGVIAVVIDFLVYRALLLGMAAGPAKAGGFIAGAVFAYVFNKSWTFEAEGGAGAWLRFCLLYGTTLACNVGTNALCLAVLPPGEVSRQVAFVAATGVSAVLNFVGMKLVVFTTPGRAAS